MGKNKKRVGVPTEVKEVKETIEKPVEEKVDFTEPEPGVTEEIVEGVVDGVDTHLNVRSTPEVKADNVVTMLKKGTKVKVIDPKKEITGSGEKWHKIRVFNVEPNITGYAMKKYIRVF